MTGPEREQEQVSDAAVAACPSSTSGSPTPMRPTAKQGWRRRLAALKEVLERAERE